MKQSEQEMKEWAQQLNVVHLPRWEELPDIDLYMDQVMTLMDRYLDLLLGRSHEKIITPAMVNNYVKLNLIPAPHKKQYNRVHRTGNERVGAAAQRRPSSPVGGTAGYRLVYGPGHDADGPVSEFTSRSES